MSAQDETTSPGANGRGDGAWLLIVSRYGGLILLVALFATFAITLADTFLTTNNLNAVAANRAVPAILALGLLLPLVAGEFDLSIGAVLGASMVAVAVLTGESGWATGPAVAVVLAAAAAIGFVNGLLVVRFGVNSFVATLATGGIITGLATIKTDGRTLFEGIPTTLTDLGRNDLLGIPLPAWYLLAIWLIVWYVLRQTPGGRRLEVIGKGRAAAELAGVAVRAHIVWAFVGSAVVSSLAGVIYLAKLGSAPADAGSPFLLEAFAAVFLGATFLRAGFFNAPGTLIASFLIAIGINGLELSGVSSFVGQVFTGVVLLGAVGLTRIESLAGHRRRRPRGTVPAADGADS